MSLRKDNNCHFLCTPCTVKILSAEHQANTTVTASITVLQVV